MNAIVETRIGHSQVLKSTKRLSEHEEELLKSYLNGDYTRVRQNIGKDANLRRMVHKMFEGKGLKSEQQLTVYRSQTAPFDPSIGTGSIISTVLEPQWSDRFGSYKYAFVVEPNVPFLKISWNLGMNQGHFTEIILPMNGYFQKSRSGKKEFGEVDAVWRFSVTPLAPLSSSLSSPTANNLSPSTLQHMSLRGLNAFRSLPKYRQSKRALLRILGYEDEFDLEIAGNTAEKEAYNNALSTSAAIVSSIEPSPDV